MPFFQRICFLLPGFVFLVAGLVLLRFPPKKINGYYGYRTARSRRDIDSWNFAQRYCAKVTIWASLADIAVCLCADFIAGRLGLAPSARLNCDTVVEFVSLFALVVVVLALTERALGKRE